MTLTLTLTPDKETRLAEQARQAGLSLDEYVQRVLDRTAEADGDTRAPTPPPQNPAPDPTLALFAQWEAEYATDDPDEIARRQRDGDDLLRSLAENPISFRRVDLGDEDAEDRAA